MAAKSGEKSTRLAEHFNIVLYLWNGKGGMGGKRDKERKRGSQGEGLVARRLAPSGYTSVPRLPKRGKKGEKRGEKERRLCSGILLRSHIYSACGA